MKHLTLDFHPRRAWVPIWAVAAALAAAAVSIAGSRISRLNDSTVELSRSLAALAPETSSLRSEQSASTDAAQKDPRRKDLHAADALLRRDWNPAFTIVENVQVTGSRLASLHLDGGSGAIRVEYETLTISQVSELTAALNAGYPVPVWDFASLSTSQPGERMRASWTARLGSLR